MLKVQSYAGKCFVRALFPYLFKYFEHQQCRGHAKAAIKKCRAVKAYGGNSDAEAAVVSSGARCVSPCVAVCPLCRAVKNWRSPRCANRARQAPGPLFICARSQV